MKARGSKLAGSAGMTRSGLDCGSPPPLLELPASEPKRRRDCGLSAHSKVWRHAGAALCALVVSLMHAEAQTYSIDWPTIDAGGGTSTCGVWAVSGTIGQPDAGTMSGGAYTLQGGFWGVVAAVQTSGVPWLTITLDPQRSTITISWPLSETRWQLQATTNLLSAQSIWTEYSYQTNGVTCSRIESHPVGNKFYRLSEP